MQYLSIAVLLISLHTAPVFSFPHKEVEEIAAEATRHGAVRPVYSPWHEFPGIAEARKGGSRVIVWTVNDPGRMEELLKEGVDGIISDNPQRLRHAVERFDANGDGKPGDYLTLEGLIDRARFEAQGHRGARDLRPENTLPAMESALDALMNTLEADIGITQDGAPVLSHDPEFLPEKCRYVDASWKADRVIWNHALADIQRSVVCDRKLSGFRQKNDPALSPVSAAFAREKNWSSPYVPPSLQDLFDFTKRYEAYYTSGAGRVHPEARRRALNAASVHFNLETKVTPRHELVRKTAPAEKFARAVAAVISRNRLEDRCGIQSFDFRTLRRVLETHPEIQTACLWGEESPLADRPLARNVILLIGDGMGPAIIGISKHYNDFALKKPALNIEKIMNEGSTGMMMTLSHSHLVTDSAAAATAFACGIKTYNEAIAVDPEKRPAGTILEEAKRAGKSAGIVSTADLADATPAAFYAHALTRYDRKNIAPQALSGGRVDVLLGGGTKYFDLAQARSEGYRILSDKKSVRRFDSSQSTMPTRILGLFAATQMPYVLERATSGVVPSLPDLTRLALGELRKNKDKGFFLMVEGGRIDHAGHENLPEAMVREYLEFDEVIGQAMAFQNENPDTLILITADHDTGGIALSKGDTDPAYPTSDSLKSGLKVFWISHHHTASPVWLIGKGPGAERVSGLRDNTDVYRIMREAMGLN